jgi:hyperosmotically inducible periplasmic protein
MNRSTHLLPIALAAALALAACSPRDNGGATAGQKVDQAVAGAKAGMEDAKNAAKDASTAVAKAATDATITTKINAALAADDQLKATKIDVDTSQGRVVLTGKAPDGGSRERATTLARAVDGVVEVDNRLVVDGKS